MRIEQGGALGGAGRHGGVGVGRQDRHRPRHGDVPTVGVAGVGKRYVS